MRTLLVTTFLFLAACAPKQGASVSLETTPTTTTDITFPGPTPAPTPVHITEEINTNSSCANFIYTLNLERSMDVAKDDLVHSRYGNNVVLYHGTYFYHLSDYCVSRIVNHYY